MVRLAYRSAAARLRVTAVDTPVPTGAETTASKLVPKRKPGTPAQPQGGPSTGSGQAAPDGAQTGASPAPPALAGYYAMEARNFADGERSLLDIRNALAAEFGPVPLEDVTKFFRDLEKAGGFTVTERK